LDAAAETTSAFGFIPADRAHAMATGGTVPQRQQGVVLFADIGGFTPFTEALEHVLGPEHGAEQIATTIDRIFDALAGAVDRHHGSIVSIAGDAITCWFDADHSLSAVACALDMQTAMAAVEDPGTTPGGSAALRLKVALAGGEARRFIVGDPETELFDVLTGLAADRAGAGEKVCPPGSVMIDRETASVLGDAIATAEPSGDFVRVIALRGAVEDDPWTAIAPGAILEQSVKPWIPPAIYEAVRTGRSRLLAEFRPIVAAFVDFSGIDYEREDAGRQLDTVLRQAQAIVTRNGGIVHDVSMGDKGSYLLALFGAPVAQGDVVRRAATAAGELQRTNPGSLRIGLHHGRVFTGLYSGRFRSAFTVAGDVVNLAARLMTAARHGQVLMTATLGGALDRRFTIEAIEPISVKGRSAPVAVCELVGTAAPSSTLSEPRYPLPMIGRERELAAIDDAIAAAKRGEGGVIAFSAEAGMGKSRLVSAALRRAAEEGFSTFAGECQPQGGGIAYLPWRPVWNALFGLPAEVDDDARREALMAALGAAAPASLALAPLLGTVLDLPIEDNDATRSMPAPARKQVLEQVLTGSLRGRAQQGPVCIALEDLHWVDALSRDLLGALVAAIADVPVLLVLTYRQLADERPVAVPAGREIELDDLSAGDAWALAALLLSHLTQGEPDADAITTITERAHGNPFYIEELVREVTERGGSTSDLPTSLENLILQRIDRLTPSQRLVAKVASVIGRRVPTAWLAGAYGGLLEERSLADDLTGLTASNLIVADTPPPDEAYLFRHVVVRDVAYKTLGYSVRQTLHEALAGYLEREIDPPPVDLIAYHYAHSANTAKEATFRRLAAELAIRNGAYADALAHVERAREIVAAQSAGPGQLEQELELALLLGSILLVTDGQGSSRAKATYDHARELSRAMPPGPAVGRAVFGLWTYYLFQGLMGPTAELADEAVALTAQSPDTGVRIMAHLAVSQTHMWTGQWEKCIEGYDQVMALYDPSQHQAYITQYAQNPRFTASNSAFWAEWMLGHPEQAAAVAEQAIEEARALGHEFTYTIAFLGRPLTAWFRRRHDEVAASVGEYVASAQRSGNPFYIALSLALDACAKVHNGDVDAGVAQLEQQLATMHALGSKLVDPLMISFLAGADLAAGRHQAGLDLLDESIARFDRDGQVSQLPDHLRLQAELLLGLRPEATDEVIALLLRSIETARSQGARSFELRAALAAARVMGAAGRGAEGRGLVASAYAGFTEGFDDPDLREARELLAAR
jgi:class 3 adenylate cyclase/predicted ATPase